MKHAINKENNFFLRHNSFNYTENNKLYHKKNNYSGLNTISGNFYKKNLDIKQNIKANHNLNKIKNLRVNKALKNIYESINKINLLNSKIKNILYDKNYNTIASKKGISLNDSNKKNINFFNKKGKIHNNIKDKKYNKNNTENNKYLNSYKMKNIDGISIRAPIKIYDSISNKKNNNLNDVETKSNCLSDYESITNQSSYISNDSFNNENSDLISNNNFITKNTIPKKERHKKWIKDIITKRDKNIKDIILLEKYKQIELQKLKKIDNIKNNKIINYGNNQDIFWKKMENLKYYNKSCKNSKTKNKINFDKDNNIYNYFDKYFKLDNEKDLNNKIIYNDKNFIKAIHSYKSSKNFFKNQIENIHFNLELNNKNKTIFNTNNSKNNRYKRNIRQIPFP